MEENSRGRRVKFMEESSRGGRIKLMEEKRGRGRRRKLIMEKKRSECGFERTQEQEFPAQEILKRKDWNEPLGPLQ